MPEYTIQTKVLAVSGHQFWTVVADSEEEALQKYKEGDYEFEHEDIEVIDTGEPTVLGRNEKS